MSPEAKTKGSILDDEAPLVATKGSEAGPREYHVVYFNVILFIYYHVALLYGLYLAFTSAMWMTVLFSIASYMLTAIGVTAGAHRLWSHRCYKAKVPLQVFLMLCHSMAFQNSVKRWVRDHRLHHKYTDTDADPHNATRGLFFSHIGWVLVRKHPQVKEKGKLLDLSDLTSNPILQFHERHQAWLLPTMSFILPTIIPVYFWQESLSNAWHLNMLRYGLILNMTLLLNSAAHSWGYKPYDSNISPTQNTVFSIFSLGEGYHNYHHVFPWDYKSAEIGNYMFCFATWFIDACAYVGLAFDLREASEEVVRARAARTGDGTDLWGHRKEAAS